MFLLNHEIINCKLTDIRLRATDSHETDEIRGQKYDNSNETFNTEVSGQNQCKSPLLWWVIQREDVVSDGRRAPHIHLVSVVIQGR